MYDNIMYNDYENDNEEPTKEEIEEYEGQEATNSEIKDNLLKIEFNTKNFANGIILDVVQTVKKTLKAEIIDEIKKEVLNDVQTEIRRNLHDIVKEIIVDFLETDKIVLSKSVWDEKTEEISVKQYMKNCIKDIIESGKFELPVKNDYNNRMSYKTITFEEYIKENIQINSDIRQYLDKNIDDIRKTINKDIKDIFNESTKTMLSNTIVQLLMANSTYKELETSLSTLATKKE